MVDTIRTPWVRYYNDLILNAHGRKYPFRFCTDPIEENYDIPKGIKIRLVVTTKKTRGAIRFTRTRRRSLTTSQEMYYLSRNFNYEGKTLYWWVEIDSSTDATFSS